MHQKEKIILQYLMDNADQYITSMELATHLTCSDRTVRNYLKSLIGMPTSQTGWKIIAKQGMAIDSLLIIKTYTKNFFKKKYWEKRQQRLLKVSMIAIIIS